MTTSSSPTTGPAKAAGLAPLGGVLIAATVAMCASAVGRVVLQVIIDVLAKRDSSVHGVMWILGGVSMRFFVAHAIAAELFIVAYPRLPTVRRQLEGEKGTLVVGAALGTLMWVVLRALMPLPGSAPVAITLASWLTFALFSGPIIVWIARPYLSMVSTSGTLGEARREMGRGLAVIFPAVFVLIWGFGTESGSSWGIAIVFIGFAALAAIVVGTSLLLGGMSKARGNTSQRWARAIPYLIAFAAIVLALMLSR